VLAAEVLHGITGGSVRVTITAMAIGLVGHSALHTRVGRNHRYNAIGNAVTAVTMGMLGHFVSPGSPFFATAGLCIPAALALALIRHKEIDPARSRQAAGAGQHDVCRWRDLAKNRSLIIFAGTMFLFQFANASVLPLATERLAAEHGHVSELITSAFVAVPQVVTAMIALQVARYADKTGRRPLLILGLAALLARAGLFAFDPGPWFLVAVQVLGGLTAAVIGILLPLVVADVTKGSGRYNLAQGAVGMVAGVGATLSTPATGFIAQASGFLTSFLLLGAVAAIGCGIVWFLLPETAHLAREDDEHPTG
jgi:predicted MFS family arabinose efflux permease